MTDNTVDKERMAFRKKRVKRIKKIIVITCVVLLILPTIMSIFLMMKVMDLQNQIDILCANNPEYQRQLDADVVQAKEKEVETSSPVSSQAVSGSAATEETKKVYLTFEDGPGTETKKILNVLKKEKVKATFFVTGKEDEYSKELYKRIVKEGHTLGMHSYSHIYDEIYKSKESFEEDFNKIYKLLYKATGEYPKYYRFPGGSLTETKVPMDEFIEVLEEKEVSYVDWNIVSPDENNRAISVSDMAEEILQDVSEYDTSIVLLYDVANRPITAKSLSAIINKLKKENYELLPVNEETVIVRHNEK